MKMSTSVLRMGHADVNLHGHVPCNLVVPATVLVARYFTCIGGYPRSGTKYQVPRQVMCELFSASVHDGGSATVCFHACERMSEPGYGGMCCKLGTCTRTGTIVPVLVL